MKKSVSLVLSLLMVISILTCVPVTVTAASESDLTFTYDKRDDSYSVTGCKTSASGEIIIPSTYNSKPVKNIKYEAFSYCTSLTSIIIPDSVTWIGTEAFYNCKNLTSITIPDSVISIGQDAFNNTAYYNNSDNWENGVLYIDNHLIKARNSISGKYAIKAGTKTIADTALINCDNLTAIVIPDGVTNIGDEAFGYCDNLNSVTIPDSVTDIGSEAFYMCSNLTAITIPYGVTNIGSHAFGFCEKLTSIEIPDSVARIGNEAFYESGYYNDSNNWENNVLYIGNHLIDASQLSGEYTIKDGTKSISYGAFSNCSSLTSISIPDGVTLINDLTFNECTKLKEIKIPDSVTEIRYGAFDNCDSLKYVFYTGSKSEWSDITIGIYNSRLTKKAIIHYNATDHKSKDWIIDTEATVYSAGEKHKECSVCGATFKTTTIPQLKCAKPVLKKVINENSYVKVTWGTVKGADKYYVYRKTGTGDYEYIGSTTNKYFNDKKASAGKTCRYIVKAKNEAGYSKASESKAVKHIDEPTLKSIANTSAGVKITWGKITGAQKYSVYRKVSGGEYKYIGATSKTYYTDKTAKSGTKYYYAIRAKRDDSISSQSASLSKLYLDNPTLNTPSSTKGGVKLTWSKVTGAEGYIVYRKTGSGSYTKIKTEKGVSNLSYTDASAKKGKKYTYKIKAYKSSTYSAYSNAKAITDKY